jgi:type I restriction enzyme S subunit
MGMITPKNGLVPRYLFHLMTSDVYKSFIDELADGTNINNLKFDDLKRFPVPHPKQDEQQRIVGILDEAFNGIVTAKANAEKNFQNARAIFESYLYSVFTQRDRGWMEKKLEEVADANCALSYGIVQPGDEYLNGLPIVRPTDLTTKVIRLGGLKRIDPKLAGGYRRTTLFGDELLLCVRGSTGVVSIASGELVGANVTRGIVPIRFDGSLLTPDFGFYLISSGEVQNQIREKTYGAALMQINIRDLRNVTLSFPPLKEQERIAAKLDALTEETQRLASIYKRKITALEALRKSLLHQAFTGQL